MADSPRGLLKLPEEPLRNIVARLASADRRGLSRASRRLLYFIFDFNRPHIVGLAALPNELVLKVIRKLSNKDQSRLARTSHRFYPLVMDNILRDDLRTQGSKLLIWAVRNDRAGLARRLLQRGADVETRYRPRIVSLETGVPLLSFAVLQGQEEMVKLLLRFGANVNAWYIRRTVTSPKTIMAPLIIAAYRGHGPVVKLLLESGASQVVDGKLNPLYQAITKRHGHVVLQLFQALQYCSGLSDSIIREAIQISSAGRLASFPRYVHDEHEKAVLRLLQAFELDGRLGEAVIGKAIKLASNEKLGTVVRYLVERQSQRPLMQVSSHDWALYPPLARSETNAMALVNRVWADAVPGIRSAPPVGIQKKSLRSSKPHATARDPASLEQHFPELVRPHQPPKVDTGRNFWAALPEQKSDAVTNKDERIHTGGMNEASSTQNESRKAVKGKKKKWEKLILS